MPDRCLICEPPLLRRWAWWPPGLVWDLHNRWLWRDEYPFWRGHRLTRMWPNSLKMSENLSRRIPK